jgi:tetratricopeptide (TPR) repeat protein
MEHKSHKSYLLFIVIGAIVFSAGCNRLRARDLLNKGVQAYKDGQFDKAVDDFQQSKALDPTLLNARLYLATAYSSQYIPGAPSEENIRLGEQAIKEFQDVLTTDPNNLSAIDGIGALLYNMGGTPFDPDKFEESKKYHMEHIKLKADDPEPYYWIGVIDWSLSFRANRDMRAEYNDTAKKKIADTDPMPPPLAAKFAMSEGMLVDEGITQLNKAIELRPDYDDAMAYLNLLYRQKADMESSTDARNADLKQADELVDKVKAIKQKKLLNPPPTT